MNPTNIVSVKNVKGIFADEAIIAVLAAAIIAPLIRGFEDALIEKTPYLRDHVTIAHGLIAVLFFSISKGQKGLPKSILLGLAGANTLLAISPFLQGVLGGK